MDNADLGSEIAAVTVAVAMAGACPFMYSSPLVEENMKRCSGGGHEWGETVVVEGGQSARCRSFRPPVPVLRCFDALMR